MEERAWEGWHVDKRVSIGHIITTATVVAAAMVFGLRLEGRVTVNETNIANNAVNIAQSRLMASAQYAEARAENQAHYSEIIRRLERISDRMEGKQDRP